MANISRPFQIAIVGVVLLAGVWLFALRGHSQSSEPGSSSSGTPAASPSAPAASAPSSSAAGEAKGAGAPTPVYHGSAPGVSGLTSAIAKAHGAVAASQRSEHQLESRSAQASSPSVSSTSTPAASAAAGASSPAAAAKTSSTGAAPVAHVPAAAANSTAAAIRAASPRAHALASGPTRQQRVEAELAAGDVVVVLFWDRKGADDLADQRVVLSFRGHRKTAVQIAKAGEVADFGTVTKGVQVVGTPTVLVFGKSGQAIVLTGLTDAFSLQQAIDEARRA
ncbi:MAG TPA: hypothetical protein VKG82_11460 [Solirubrobacteraceae bacterium]|nr:hypothetical protein [Solirubrobacteraceae bacterium]